MYLTRLSLDLRSAQVRRDLADPYDMHRTLVRAFVSNVTQSPPRFLWRLEPALTWSDPTLLVQSESAADWSVLSELPNYLKTPTETKMLALDQLLVVDGRYRFRLFANPTVTRNSKRYGLASEEDQLAWLSRQGARFGFNVEVAMIMASDVLASRKGSIRINLQRACFEGVLRIADLDLVVQALIKGIGPGKAFGCGLLSLVRY